MPCVYILRNSEGKYYIGSTVNLAKRLKHHAGGYTPSTKRLGKMSLVFSQEYETLKIARYVENRLKKLKRKDYIEKIIKDGFIKMKVLD
jgi:putative endonuclease